MKRFALFAAALVLTVPAAAKPIAGQPSDDLSIQAMHNYAACVADHTREGAIELLALDYRSPEYVKKVNRLAHGTSGYCAPGQAYRFSAVLFAGGLAERLMVEKLDAARLANLAAYDAAKAPIEARNPTELTAICVVRAEPAKTWAIFQSEPTSRGELDALQAIGPTLMGCVPSGTKMAFNKQGVRAMLALAAYRLSQLQAVATADGNPNGQATGQ